MNTDRSNILISGGEGYIGKNISRVLSWSKSFKPFSPTFHELDFRNSELVLEFCKKYDIKTLIHSASVSLIEKSYPVDIVEDNVRLFLTSLACQRAGIRLITFCSGSIYGREWWDFNLREIDALNRVPKDAHSLCKYLFERYRRDSRAGFTSIRLFGLFGGEENYLFKFVPNTIVKVLLGLPVIIAKDRLMSNTHVGDLGRFLFEILRKEEELNFDINFGRSPLLLSDLARSIIKIANPAYDLLRVESLSNGYSPDQSKLKILFPEFKYEDLEKSILRTVNFWRDRLPLIDREALQSDRYLKSVRDGSIGGRMVDFLP